MRDRSTSVKRQPDQHRAETRHPVEDLPAEGTNVLFDVWLVSRAATGMLDAALGPSGLTADEFGIYSVLSSADTMTPSELARWMSAPATTVSSQIKRFEARGHVVRERNPDDGRSYVLRLTDEGRAAHLEAVRCFIPPLDSVVRSLGRSEAAVRRSLAALRQAIDETSDEGR